MCINATSRIDDFAVGTVQPSSKEVVDKAFSNIKLDLMTALEKQRRMSAADIFMKQIIQENLPLDASSTRLSVMHLNALEQSCVSALTDSFSDGDYDLDSFDWLEYSISNVDTPPVAPRRMSTMDDITCSVSVQDEPPQIPRRRSTKSQRKSMASIGENRRSRRMSILTNRQSTSLMSKRWNDVPVTSLSLQKRMSTLTISESTETVRTSNTPPIKPRRRSTYNSKSPVQSNLEDDCDTDDEDAICTAFEKRYGRTQRLSKSQVEIDRRSSF